MKSVEDLIMTFTEKNVAGFPLFELEGKIYSSTDCSNIVNRIKSLIDEGCVQILLDFSRVGYINSSGIGAMLTCIKRAKSRGGDLHFIAIPKKIAGYFKITKLDTILGIYENAEAAVASIQSGPLQIHGTEGS
jgi:anti-sigma B factor antagonist